MSGDEGPTETDPSESCPNRRPGMSAAEAEKWSQRGKVGPTGTSEARQRREEGSWRGKRGEGLEGKKREVGFAGNIS